MAKGKVNRNWKKYVLEWQKSGKKSAGWCRENNIPLTTFLGWKKRLKIGSKDSRGMKKPEFIEIKNALSNTSITPDSGIVLECNGVKVHLKNIFDKETLKECLDCLRGISC